MFRVAPTVGVRVEVKATTGVTTKDTNGR
jgi:hypothetical protein